MNWEEYKSEFVPDGSLRDIYIKHTRPDDWQAFIDFLRSTEATLDYFIDGEPAALPANIQEVLLDKAHSHLLAIGLDEITVNCHFFVTEEIELDLDPRDIDCEARARVIFRLMSTVGRVLKQEVILTRENCADRPIFTYKPGAGIRYLPPANDKR